MSPKGEVHQNETCEHAQPLPFGAKLGMCLAHREKLPAAAAGSDICTKHSQRVIAAGQPKWGDARDLRNEPSDGRTREKKGAVDSCEAQKSDEAGQ